jgi:hypothetical protein
MCRAGNPQPNKQSFTLLQRCIGKVWPVHPLLVLALLPVMPSSCFLNRGFTIWFHWASVIYLLTQSKFLEKCLVLIGTSVCLGWYSSIAYDYFQYGRLALILYDNSPPIMTEIMLDETTGQPNYGSMAAVSTMLLAHALDTLGHPLLTHYFWRRHRQTGGCLPTILTWPVVVSSWLFSRIWSILHTYYNFGRVQPYYVGYDVYVLPADHLDCWYPAYVAESLLFSFVVMWKLFGEPHQSSNANNKLRTNGNEYETKPRLLLSQSTVSVSSSVD